MVSVTGQPKTGLVLLEDAVSTSFPESTHLYSGFSFQASKAGFKELLKIIFSKDGQLNEDLFKIHIIIITDR